MTLKPWSLSGALSQQISLVQLKDLASFKEAVSSKTPQTATCPDQILIDVINYDIETLFILAGSVDPDDPVRYADQERFKLAYRTFQSVIDSLAEPLRTSVQLPVEYRELVVGSNYLNFATKKAGGRPVEWRRDEFYQSMLFVYQLMTGKRGAGTIDGPAVRFMRAFTDHLQGCLAYVEDKDHPLFAILQGLWKLPPNETFLKDWFSNKGGAATIHEKVEMRIATERRFNDDLNY